MATVVIKELEGTLSQGASLSWGFHDINPPFGSGPVTDRQPNWIVEWQAVPIFNYRYKNLIKPASGGGGPSSTPRPAINTDLVAVVQEQDTSLTHVVTITCSDRANTGYDFIVTFVLYAVFTDLS